MTGMMQGLFTRFRRHCFLGRCRQRKPYSYALIISNLKCALYATAATADLRKVQARSSQIMAPTVKKVMTQPISVIFRMLQNKQRLQIWLYENTSVRFEGKLVGFDEYMNVVLDDAEEVDLKRGKRTSLGRMLLKGDAITLIQSLKG